MTEKKRINIDPKTPLSELALKKLLNEQFALEGVNYRVVKQAIDNMTERFKRPIMDLIEFADDSLHMEITIDVTGKKKYEMKFDLSEEELEMLAIKLPIACMYVQEFLNDKAIDVSLAEYMFDDAVTESLKNISGGDAKERMRFAIQSAEMEYLTALIKKQVYLNLRSYIDRADKVYEGVKKVLDGKNRDKFFNTKATSSGCA